jgi:hypothetical protein
MRVARPEGFEPPTLRSVVPVSSTRLQVAKKFMNLKSKEKVMPNQIRPYEPLGKLCTRRFAGAIS